MANPTFKGQKTMTNLEKAKKIKLLLMDVDGVLTDGKIYFLHKNGSDFLSFNAFHAVDGIGLMLMRHYGIKTGMITGRISKNAEQRAHALNIKYLYQGFLSKLGPFEKIIKHAKVKPSEVAYIGDDWTDIPVLKKVGFSCAPQNARDEVKKSVDMVLKHNGGEGAVREMCEFILKSQGHWKKLMKSIDNAEWTPVPKEKIINVKFKR
jgi:3-deoxy-D-manno-octulosonate 8-phosphate phosphatase (KDO 8-P phosphatase)